MGSMRLTRVLAEFNQRVTNKMIGLVASCLPWWAMLVHRAGYQVARQGMDVRSLASTAAAGDTQKSMGAI